MRLLLLAVLAFQAPPFTHSVSHVTPAQLPYSWRTGCPVGPSHLRRLRISYWGFDGRAHAGTLVVNADAVGDLVRVFSRLYAARFPIRRMRPIDAYRGRDEPSLEADNTSAFNCRYAVAPGPRRWSVHAFGRAIDVNPIENPYVTGSGTTSHAASRKYVDRSSRRHRAMILRGDQTVRAFRAEGWGWGGSFSGSHDYQHFSADGR